jgi:hypothetical protein
MVFLRQKQNKKFIYYCTLFFIATALLFPYSASGARGDLVLYDPEIDVSMSLYKPLINEGDRAPDIDMGIYFGGYLSRKSRFFTDYFNAERIYTIFEGGVAINPIKNEDSNYITIPLQVDIAYRFGSGKFSFLPFISMGLNFTFNRYLNDPAYNESFRDGPNGAFSMGTGFELRRTTVKYSALRLKFDYGILFDGRVESGYMPYMRLRMPLPFIP